MASSTGRGLIVTAGTHCVVAVAGGIGIVISSAMEGDDTGSLIGLYMVGLLGLYMGFAVLLSTLSAMHAAKSCDSISGSLIAGAGGSVIGVALAVMILIIFTGMAIDDGESIGDLMEAYFEEAFVAAAIANAAAGLGGAYLGSLGHLHNEAAPSLGAMHQHQMDAAQPMQQQAYEAPSVQQQVYQDPPQY